MSRENKPEKILFVVLDQDGCLTRYPEEPYPIILEKDKVNTKEKLKKGEVNAVFVKVSKEKWKVYIENKVNNTIEEKVLTNENEINKKILDHLNEEYDNRQRNESTNSSISKNQATNENNTTRTRLKEIVEHLGGKIRFTNYSRPSGSFPESVTNILSEGSRSELPENTKKLLTKFALLSNINEMINRERVDGLKDRHKKTIIEEYKKYKEIKEAETKNLSLTDEELVKEVKKEIKEELGKNKENNLISEYRKWLKEYLLNRNKYFIENLVDEAKKNSYTKIILCNGSSRQDYQTDVSNSLSPRNQEFTPSIFISVEVLKEILEEKLNLEKDNKLTVEASPISSPDLEKDYNTNNFSYCTHKKFPVSFYPKAPYSSPNKLAIIFRIIADAIKNNNRTEQTIRFYDDREDILENLNTFFKENKNIIPSWVTIETFLLSPKQMNPKSSHGKIQGESNDNGEKFLVIFNEIIKEITENKNPNEVPNFDRIVTSKINKTKLKNDGETGTPKERSNPTPETSGQKRKKKRYNDISTTCHAIDADGCFFENPKFPYLIVSKTDGKEAIKKLNRGEVNAVFVKTTSGWDLHAPQKNNKGIIKQTIIDENIREYLNKEKEELALFSIMESSGKGNLTTSKEKIRETNIKLREIVKTVIPGCEIRFKDFRYKLDQGKNRILEVDSILGKGKKIKESNKEEMDFLDAYHNLVSLYLNFSYIKGLEKKEGALENKEKRILEKTIQEYNTILEKVPTLKNKHNIIENEEVTGLKNILKNFEQLISNQLIHNPKKENLTRRYRSWVKNYLLNRKNHFIESLIENAIKNHSNQITLFSASARGSLREDWSHSIKSETNITPFIYTAIDVTKEILLEKIKEKKLEGEINVIVDKTTAVDKFSNHDEKEHGEYFDYCIFKKINSEKINKKILYYTQNKTLEISYLLQEASKQNKGGKNIIFNFYDDQNDILDGAKAFFTDYPFLIPDNVTLNICEMSENEMTPITKTTIKGTGKNHTLFDDLFKKIKNSGIVYDCSKELKLKAEIEKKKIKKIKKIKEIKAELINLFNYISNNNQNIISGTDSWDPIVKQCKKQGKKYSFQKWKLPSIFCTESSEKENRENTKNCLYKLIYQFDNIINIRDKKYEEYKKNTTEGQDQKKIDISNSEELLNTYQKQLALKKLESEIERLKESISNATTSLSSRVIAREKLIAVKQLFDKIENSMFFNLSETLKGCFSNALTEKMKEESGLSFSEGKEHYNPKNNLASCLYSKSKETKNTSSTKFIISNVEKNPIENDNKNIGPVDNTLPFTKEKTESTRETKTIQEILLSHRNFSWFRNNKNKYIFDRKNERSWFDSTSHKILQDIEDITTLTLPNASHNNDDLPNIIHNLS